MAKYGAYVLHTQVCIVYVVSTRHTVTFLGRFNKLISRPCPQWAVFPDPWTDRGSDVEISKGRGWIADVFTVT